MDDEEILNISMQEQTLSFPVIEEEIRCSVIEEVIPIEKSDEDLFCVTMVGESGPKGEKGDKGDPGVSWAHIGGYIS